MSRYWLIKVTSHDNGWEPVKAYGILAAEFQEGEAPSRLEFVDASELFDFPQLKTTGLGYSELYAFRGDLDVSGFVQREHKGRKYYLLPVETGA